jgi:hypothetical protein
MPSFGNIMNTLINISVDNKIAFYTKLLIGIIPVILHTHVHSSIIITT